MKMKDILIVDNAASIQQMIRFTLKFVGQMLPKQMMELVYLQK